MSRDLDLLTVRALDDLDAAQAAPLTPAQVGRADQTLAHVLASDPAGTTPVALPPRRVTSTRRTARRVAVVGGLAAAATVGIVGVQLLGGGESAAASWTAQPHPPTTPEQVSASESCRDSLSESLAANDLAGVTPQAMRAASVVVSEQRGEVTLVVLGDGRGLDATCLTRPGALFGNISVGSVGYAPAPTTGPREVLVTSGGSATLDDTTISVLLGFVGSDVAAVTVHTPEKGDVDATVANGHLAAWWPGGSQDTSAPDPEATITFTDGTSETRPLGV